MIIKIFMLIFKNRTNDYATYFYLSTVNCQLSTVNCQLSTINCQLSTKKPLIYFKIELT